MREREGERERERERESEFTYLMSELVARESQDDKFRPEKGT